MSVICEAYSYNKPGPPEKVLELNRHHRVSDKAGPNEVVVQVEAAALNPVDWKLMELVPRKLGKHPAVTGCDYAGQVLHSGSTLFSPGDSVFGMIGSGLKVTKGKGTLSQMISAPADTCAKYGNPESVNLSASQAAGASLVGLTALEMISVVEKRIAASSDSRRKRALVSGGSTSVGLSLVPILKHRGYEVMATCSQAKASLVEERGASKTFDYRKASFIKDIKEECQSNQPFDAIFDCADSFTVWKEGAVILNKDGIFINVGVDLSSGVVGVLQRLVSYYLWPAFLGGVPRRYARPGGFGTRDRMHELADLLQKGVLKPVIDSEYKWTEAKAAFERLKSNRATGKVIVLVDPIQ